MYRFNDIHIPLYNNNIWMQQLDHRVNTGGESHRFYKPKYTVPTWSFSLTPRFTISIMVDTVTPGRPVQPQSV